jgi:hypothetical protein
MIIPQKGDIKLFGQRFPIPIDAVRLMQTAGRQTVAGLTATTIASSAWPISIFDP